MKLKASEDTIFTLNLFIIECFAVGFSPQSLSSHNTDWTSTALPVSVIILSDRTVAENGGRKRINLRKLNYVAYLIFIRCFSVKWIFLVEEHLRSLQG